MRPSHDLVHRAIGALVGMAVGDALGAPFEFGPSGAYRDRFPDPVVGGVGEMVGNAAYLHDAAEDHGGQAMLDFMWQLMRQPDSITKVPDGIEDFFVKWRKQMNAVLPRAKK